MSCNGCRVLRKGCSENCALRPCLQWIDTPEAQGNATVFVAKFFGRAGLMEFISAVPMSERTALFQSLLYEACGRTVNPIHGAVGLLWSGNWHVCQEAVETVLKGGTIRPLSSTFMAIGSNVPRNLSTKLQLPTNSKERTAAVHQLPSLPVISESPSACPLGSVQFSKPKRTLDVLYEREVEQDSFGPSECKQHRPGSCCDIPKRNFEHSSTVAQASTARAPTFFSASNPPLLHREVFAGVPAKANSVTGASQVHRVAPMPRFNDHGRDISCPRRTRGDDLSFIHEDASSENRDNLELDLTLSSARLQSTRSGEKTKSCTESMRVSSPSTISFNSEGSVTDLGSSKFPISSCSGHHLGSRPWRESEHKLLDLLV